MTPLEPEIIAGLSGLGYNMSVGYTAMSTVTSVSKLYGKNEASGRYIGFYFYGISISRSHLINSNYFKIELFQENQFDRVLSLLKSELCYMCVVVIFIYLQVIQGRMVQA